MPVSDSRLLDEAGRRAALDRYGLRTEPAGSLDGFQRITDLVADLLDAAVCSISIITDDVQYFAAVTGEAKGLTDRSEAICDRTIAGRGALVIDDLTADPRFAKASFVTDQRHFRSYAGTPLTTPDGYNLGALCIIDREPRQFTERELSLLARFSDLVVEQMELRTLADMDFLTGAMSRRAFTERSAAILRRTAVSGEASLVVFDVDHFKQVNDRFGHGQGDAVLRDMVGVVSATLRPGDAIGRIGGEEFAVVLPGCGVDEAFECAERYRLAIGAMTSDQGPRVTASFGISEARASLSFEAWLAEADHALYEAKRQGRNRTVVANGRRHAA